MISERWQGTMVGYDEILNLHLSDGWLSATPQIVIPKK